MVAAPAVDMTCSVLKSMVDLMTLPEPNTNKCSTNNLDEAACVNTFITRTDGTATYEPSSTASRARRGRLRVATQSQVRFVRAVDRVGGAVAAV